MAAAVADIDQSATLFNFLRCLRDYLNADGAGLTPKRLHTRVYDRLVSMVFGCRNAGFEGVHRPVA